MKKQLASIAFVAILVLGVSPAMAQNATTTIPGHPAVSEVDQRLQNQQNRIDAGVADGQINAKQEARDDARDAKVSQQLSADEAKDNGHITGAEQTHLNNELNKNSADIYKQRHK